MIERVFWREALDQLWRQAPIVWLSGVRRSGKTTFCRSLPDTLYLNCDLPSTVERLADPEVFFRSVREPRVVLDEVHQLPDPSRLLKIGADVFPRLKILATGSSTLAATRKFKDSLTGRKRSLSLTPVLFDELGSFGADVDRRLHRGGLPPALLSDEVDDGFYAEWMDSYYARDVQELFRVEKRTGFLRLFDLLLRQSGGLVEPTTLARACELSRPTVLNYLDVFEVTQTVRILRPFHGGGKAELLRQPKIYAFDTGFVRFARGWGELRPEDKGVLWEHLVLDHLQFFAGPKPVHYWRDIKGREVDFVIPIDRGTVDAIECKWSPTAFDPANILAFRASHPKGRNILICPTTHEPRVLRLGGLSLDVLPLTHYPISKAFDSKTH